MWTKCQEWRKTVDGIGIEGIYEQLDAYDVRPPFLSPSFPPDLR